MLECPRCSGNRPFTPRTIERQAAMRGDPTKKPRSGMPGDGGLGSLQKGPYRPSRKPGREFPSAGVAGWYPIRYHHGMDVRARAAAELLRQARLRAGLTLRSAAEKAATSHATLAAYEAGRKVPAVSTFLRLLRAYGFAVDIELAPRIREADGQPRGAELEAVLALAEQFPARHRKTLAYPRFGRP